MATEPTVDGCLEEELFWNIFKYSMEDTRDGVYVVVVIFMFL